MISFKDCVELEGWNVHEQGSTLFTQVISSVSIQTLTKQHKYTTSKKVADPEVKIG